MKRIILSCFVLTVIFCMVAGHTYAEGLSGYFKYMDRWEYGANWDEDEGPSYFADLIFPVYEPASGDRLVFIEPRFSYSNNDWLYNMGGGYRQLVMEREWALGGNMFYDHQWADSHYRVGWGVEALSSYAEFRANSYLGLSGWRNTDVRVNQLTRERPVDGFDVEAGLPVPYYSRLKLFGGYEWYNFEQFKNKSGWTLRVEFTPIPYLVIDGSMNNDTKSNFDWGGTIAFRFPFGGDEEESYRSPFQFDETMFPDSDATIFMGALVERHHEIVVEKSVEAVGLSVEVLRGN
jgi:hypothetical protein